jgi:hypothetical protein
MTSETRMDTTPHPLGEPNARHKYGDVHSYGGPEDHRVASDPVIHESGPYHDDG